MRLVLAVAQSLLLLAALLFGFGMGWWAKPIDHKERAVYLPSGMVLQSGKNRCLYRVENIIYSWPILNGTCGFPDFPSPATTQSPNSPAVTGNGNTFQYGGTDAATH